MTIKNPLKYSSIILDQEQIKKNTLDILAFGDIVVDDFIKLEEAELLIDDKKKLELAVEFGNKIPYKESIKLYGVGNSANVAVSGARLGLKTALYTFLGGDHYGEECIKSIQSNNVSTEYFNIYKNEKTNYHYVLWFNTDRTILIKHYPYKLIPLNIHQRVNWIYLSSLGEYAKNIYPDILKYLKKNPKTKLAFQPGTFQLRMGIKHMSEFYKRCEYFCCNIDEAKDLLNTKKKDPKYLLDELAKCGPKIITITDGPNGSYLRDRNGISYALPVYPDIADPVERTGAGDAFTSTMLSFLEMGYDEKEAILYAPINSMNVVQHIGAQQGLLTLSQIKKLYKKRPTNYILKEL